MKIFNLFKLYYLFEKIFNRDNIFRKDDECGKELDDEEQYSLKLFQKIYSI